MLNIEITKIDFITEIPINQLHATGFRGSIGNLDLIKNRSEFHHHSEKGLIYKHPLIQYRIFEGQFQIAGIEEGSYLLKAFPDLDQITVYDQKYYFKCKKKSLTETVGLTDQFLEYKMLTPWLPLNQVTFREYKKKKRQQEKVDYLQKKLIGHLLSFSKIIKYEVPGEIIMKLNIYEYGRSFTNDIKIGLLGYMGTFETNFKLPQWGWGIGKWAARGYGLMRLMEE